MSSYGLPELVLDVVPAGILVVTPALEVVFWNRWMEEQTGRTREEVVGQRLHVLFPEMDLAALERRVRQVLQLGNLAFFDPRIHEHLFPVRVSAPLGIERKFMPQSAVVAPLPATAEQPALACITVLDETPAITAEARVEKAHQQLLETSRHDALTGVLNRGYLYERLTEECKRIQRSGDPLSVILLDLDHFKAVNDAYGHPAGDAALVATANILQDLARETDLVGRFGGEEFAVLLPGTELVGARELAERLRAGIEGIRLEWRGAVMSITGSFGIAQAVPPFEADTVLARADAALYRAKAEGRNRCVFADVKTVRVLVADDSQLARKLLLAQLPAAYAYDLLEAANGEEAIEAYRAMRPDVVFLDLHMPTDGYEVLERILGLDPTARVVVVTADVQSITGQRARAAGAIAVLQKPVRPEALDDVLLQVVTRDAGS